jgi:glycosyltransferase A (GT-A) superfamily protein (DUF2064 family)
MGQAGAALLHHRLLVRTLRHLRNTGFEVSVAVGGDAPDYADIAERAGADVLLMPQGDVGRRLARTIRHRRSAAILVDSDAPGIDAILVRHAADALGQYDLVLGPNWSGGTYLIGLRSPYHVYRLFRGVRWRTAHMLEDLLARVPKHWIVGLLPVLADVNDAAGLREAGSDHAPPRRRSSSRGLIAVKR